MRVNPITVRVHEWIQKAFALENLSVASRCGNIDSARAFLLSSALRPDTAATPFVFARSQYTPIEQGVYGLLIDALVNGLKNLAELMARPAVYLNSQTGEWRGLDGDSRAHTTQRELSA